MGAGALPGHATTPEPDDGDALSGVLTRPVVLSHINIGDFGDRTHTVTRPKASWASCYRCPDPRVLPMS